MNRTFGIIDAIQSIAPSAAWTLIGDDYSGLDWLDTVVEKPTEEALTLEVNRLQAEYDFFEYQRLRKVEYPNFEDYLDGIVKGDQDQVQAYINACLAVKEKYPKPSV